MKVVLLIQLVVVNLVLLVFATCAVASDRLSDEWKEATITARLEMSDVLDRYNIDAEVSESKVKLSGIVSSEIERDLAEEIAKEVDGVISVGNEIKVKEDVAFEKRNSLGQKLVDSSTTAKVKSRFLWSRGIPAMDINVDTVDGVVTLNGTVELESQKKLAEKLAMNTDGVRRVRNLLNSRKMGENKVGSIDLDKVENNAGEAIEGAGNTISDVWVKTKVAASLNFSRSLSLADVSVNVASGIVTISGVAYSQADKELAEEIAKDIKGVKGVVNKLKVV